MRRSRVNGLNAARRRSAPPASTEGNEAPDPAPTALTARERMATMTNLESTRATSVSTRRRHQCATAGQTRLAKASGRNRTAAYTAAARTSSSTHSNSEPATTSIAPRRTTKAGTAASPVAASEPSTPARLDSADWRSAPVPVAIAVLMASVAPSASCTSWTATAVSTKASGSCTSADRTRVPALCR